MEPRLNFYKFGFETMNAMSALVKKMPRSGLGKSLIELVRLCAFQINGCACCVEVHTSDARTAGESERRLSAVAVGRETLSPVILGAQLQIGRNP